MIDGICIEAIMDSNKKNKSLENNSKGPDFLEYKGDFLKKINSDITLFNQSNKGKPYNKIFIYENNGKIYSYNNEGENIFVNGFHGDYEQNFDLIEKDGIILLQIGLSGANYYFQENGKQYFPKNMSQKIEEALDNYTLAKKESFKQIREIAYTDEIEKSTKVIENIIYTIKKATFSLFDTKLIQNTKKLTITTINQILDNVNFSNSTYIKKTKNYTDLDKK